MTTIEQRMKQKLIKLGFRDYGIGPLVPPKGMGSFAASEIIERCKAEAEAEATAPVDEIAELSQQEREKLRFAVSIYAHWHEQNPWNDHILYVPIEELAECWIGIGRPISMSDGSIVTGTALGVQTHWAGYARGQYEFKLDAYILTGPTLTGGIRFGPDGPDYLSPGFSLPKLWALKQKYEGR